MFNVFGCIAQFLNMHIIQIPRICSETNELQNNLFDLGEEKKFAYVTDIEEQP